ncbi:MAG: hypothetical protein ACJAVR_001303 [Paracoccaceae bacterium]|jgi:hypothetical protein
MNNRTLNAMIRAVLATLALATCAPVDSGSAPPAISNSLNDPSQHRRCFDPRRGIVYAHSTYTLSCLSPDYQISKSDFDALARGERFESARLPSNQNDTTVTDRCYEKTSWHRPDLARSDGLGCDPPAYRVSEAEHRKRAR